MRNFFVLLLVVMLVCADQVIVDPISPIHAQQQPSSLGRGNVLELFSQIARIPRCSYNMAQISTFVQKWATTNRYTFQQDEAGNLLVQVPATAPQLATSPKVCIQSHMDMVCEKSSEKQFDFTKDSISLQFDGDFVKADGTTLGADNGIGMALAMAVAEDGEHGPLELLFTVNEEVGLEGASQLKNDMLSSKYLINLDSGEVDAIVYYCAGGKTTEGHLAIESCPRKYGTMLKMRISGLKGGHSGGDIHLHRANAIRLMGSLLDIAILNEPNMELVNVTGGSAVNAIPREAEAYILVQNTAAVTVATTDLFNTFKSIYNTSDSEMNYSIQEVSNDSLPAQVFCSTFTSNLVRIIKNIRNGVITALEGETSTSSNIGVLKTLPNEVVIGIKHRSIYEHAKLHAANESERILKDFGATVVTKGEYSGWEPKANSTLLNIAKEVFEAQRNKQPKVKGVHGGLEPGIISAKHKNPLDMISISPEILDAHSPSERLQLSTVQPTYDLLQAILKQLKE